MKRLPKKLKFKVSYDIELDTSEILEKVRWASAPKINSNTDFSESWLAENWKEIIKWLEFIYNKWDGNYDPYPHKRLKMGKIANKYCDIIILTDDNPRNENPSLIRKTLKKYCSKAKDISNRRLAIHTAISEINKNDILIIAGKGHEKFQIIKNKNYLFDDYKIAKNFIK